MASPELEALLRQLREQQRDSTSTVEQLRAGMPLTRPRRTTTVTPADAGGVPGEWSIDVVAEPQHRLLYLHGGGYVIGSPATHRNLTARISQAGRLAVLSLDYRLGPETKFPGAVEDATTALAWLRQNGPLGPSPAQSLFIAGDSAGGGLALATLLMTRDTGAALPDAAVLLSPWTDLTHSGKSMETRAAADPSLNRARLERYAREYLARPQDARDPLASPLLGELSDLPPLLIQVGDAEVLLDDSTRLAALTKAAGVDTTLTVFPELTHVFQAWAPILPEGQQAIERIGAFLRAHVATAAG